MGTEEITRLILDARDRARSETSDDPEPGLTSAIEWPVTCSVGPGLEGAIACESKVGYVNGSKGWLIYRGYD
ncbi:MAG: citrate/2-methylcitrate synthase, partial [Spirochaetota bacterium]